MADASSELAAGSLLVAVPMLGDPNFHRAVILLCEHGDDGSFGLVLNHPLTLGLGEVLAELEGQMHPLWLGGPVQPNTLHFLHRHGPAVPEALPVADGVWWGGDFEAIKALLADTATEADLRFFLGYTGWSPGQLDDEVDEGSWIVCSADAGWVFPNDPQELWRHVLRALGGEYALLANFPDDPRMN